MSTTRFDGFRFIHKALRAIMFDAARMASTTDFADGAQATAAAAVLSRMLGFLQVVRRGR